VVVIFPRFERMRLPSAVGRRPAVEMSQPSRAWREF
jgi:hypothetical protein